MLRKLKQLVRKLKDFTITGKEKAVAAFLYSGVTAYMAENHLHFGDLWSIKTLIALVVAVAGHQVVYWLSNSGAEL